VLKGRTISSVRQSSPVASHCKIVRVYASTVRAELIEMLLGYVEVLLGVSYEPLVGGREEMIVWFVFDEWARRTRTSHFGTLSIGEVASQEEFC